VATLATSIFAESGLFFGFFLAGDSLLLTAGLLASRMGTGFLLHSWDSHADPRLARQPRKDIRLGEGPVGTQTHVGSV